MEELTNKTANDFGVFISDAIKEDIKKALDIVSPILVNNVRSTFDVSGARGGREKWVVTNNPTPLLGRGELKNSIEGLVEQQGNDFIIVIGTDKDYAQKHNEGLEGFPKREFMFITDGDFQVIDSILNNVAGGK